MSDELVTAIVSTFISAIIAGVFSLISKRMELAHAGGGTATSAPSGSTTKSPATAVRPALGRINYGLVVLYIGILQLVFKLSAVILTLAWLAIGASPGGYLPAVWIVGTFVGIAAFLWVGLRLERATMWTHLILIALGSGVILVIINAFFLDIPFSVGVFIPTLVQVFITMGIGGAIAYAIRR